MLCEYTENEDNLKDVECRFVSDHSAVFDLKWCRHPLNDRAVLCIANTNGCVVLQELSRDDGQRCSLTNVSTSKLHEDNLICSVDWSTNKFPRCVHDLCLLS